MPGSYATLLATIVGLVAVYIQYRLGLRNRAIRLANALAAEISVVYDEQTKVLKRNRIAVFKKAEEGTERFTTWGGRLEYPIYDHVTTDILLLPEETVRAAILFYEQDSELRGRIMNMSSETFFALHQTRRMEYVQELYDSMEKQYATAKEDAVKRLENITKKVRLPW
jgi:hypothetical protein